MSVGVWDDPTLQLFYYTRWWVFFLSNDWLIDALKIVKNAMIYFILFFRLSWICLWFGDVLRLACFLCTGASTTRVCRRLCVCVCDWWRRRAHTAAPLRLCGCARVLESFIDCSRSTLASDSPVIIRPLVFRVKFIHIARAAAHTHTAEEANARISPRRAASLAIYCNLHRARRFILGWEFNW